MEGKMKNAHILPEILRIERHTFQAECDYWEDQLHEHLHLNVGDQQDLIRFVCFCGVSSGSG